MRKVIQLSKTVVNLFRIVEILQHFKKCMLYYLNKYLESARYVPKTVLDTENTVEKKKETKIMVFKRFVFSGDSNEQNK